MPPGSTDASRASPRLASGLAEASSTWPPRKASTSGDRWVGGPGRLAGRAGLCGLARLAGLPGDACHRCHPARRSRRKRRRSPAAGRQPPGRSRGRFEIGHRVACTGSFGHGLVCYPCRGSPARKGFSPCASPAAVAAAAQVSSVASTVISRLPLSALEIGQPSLASCAAASKSAGEMPCDVPEHGEARGGDAPAIAPLVEGDLRLDVQVLRRRIPAGQAPREGHGVARRVGGGQQLLGRGGALGLDARRPADGNVSEYPAAGGDASLAAMQGHRSR